MARKLRVPYPGAVHHVLNWGDRQEDIFQSDHDLRLFLETLGQAFEQPAERGGCLGGEAYRRELLAAVDELVDSQDAGEEVRRSALASVERIAREELGGLDWGSEELERRRKGDPHKVLIAARVRRETTMTLAWIADRLRMGAPGHVAHLLYWQGRKEVACENTLVGSLISSLWGLQFRVARGIYYTRNQL
jgi:hypothetical protein